MSEPSTLSHAFATLVAQIPAARRLKLRDEILLLQQHLGSTADLIADRRYANCAVWTRDQDDVGSWEFENPLFPDLTCSLAEAAAYVGKKPTTLSVYLSKNKGEVTFVRNIKNPAATKHMYGSQKIRQIVTIKKNIEVSHG